MSSLRKAALALCVVAATAPLLADEPRGGSVEILPLGEVESQRAVVWLESSLKRIFPQSPAEASRFELLAARNSKIAFQVGIRNETDQVLHVTCTVEQAGDLDPRVRFVGLTPVAHFALGTPAGELDGAGKYLPGLVPDVLWPQSTAEICPYESRSFWVTLTIPRQASPGDRTILACLTLKEGGRTVKLPARLTVAPLELQRRHDFPVTHWWWPQSTCDYYRTEMFDERWWQITRAQLENMYQHGSDVAYVPMFSFSFPQVVERPGQMLLIREPVPGTYEFDWTQVKRLVDLCRQIGFREFEWSHLWKNWTVANPTLIYKFQEDKYTSLWPPDEPQLSPKVIQFLRQFLPELQRFLDQEKLVEHSYFHLADEPQTEYIARYRAARDFLRREAPWMQVIDAVQDVQYGAEHLTDVPVCLLNVAPAYADRDISHWVYFCCIPTGEYVNRFMDTPLPKIRMAGWTFYRLRANGFLHWGFNYWNGLNSGEPVDPFVDPTAAAAPGIPAGDPFVIYPGPDGQPLDSIRWEVFAESLQDYALLQSVDIRPDDELLEDIKSYREFPRSEGWLQEARRQLLLGTADRPEVVTGN